MRFPEEWLCCTVTPNFQVDNAANPDVNDPQEALILLLELLLIEYLDGQYALFSSPPM